MVATAVMPSRTASLVLAPGYCVGWVLSLYTVWALCDTFLCGWGRVGIMQDATVYRADFEWDVTQRLLQMLPKCHMAFLWDNVSIVAWNTVWANREYFVVE